MPGPSDISAILSQAGRIEKINQSSFVHPDVAKQVLTEEEARARLQKSREVNETQKGREIAAKDRERRGDAEGRKRQPEEKSGESSDVTSPEETRKHLIDVVV
ncbi:MAG: hypothetical protein WAR22_11150 [Desulfomonilia bacterium]|jgi:hypothetical protein